VLYRVRPRSLDPVTATDETGRPRRIWLSDTARSDWRIVGAPGKETILAVWSTQGRNLVDPGGWATSYITYRRVGDVWRRVEKEEAESWYWNQPFPERSKFP
jgi:hypothetical protein